MRRKVVEQLFLRHVHGDDGGVSDRDGDPDDASDDLLFHGFENEAQKKAAFRRRVNRGMDFFFR
jgi:hypothetical protein